MAYGAEALEQLPELIGQSGASKIMLLTGTSLATEGTLIQRLRQLLGSTVVGVFSSCVAHTPDTSVEAAHRAFVESSADGLLSVGGSSVVDTAKGVALMAAVGPDLTPYQAVVHVDEHGRRTMVRGITHDQLHSLVAPRRGFSSRAGAGSIPPIFAVPTTLSGAEFTEHAGITIASSGVKRQIYHPELLPLAVIMDPAATATTPATLWLSTGVKVLDHAVEIIASPRSSPVSEAACLGALRRIFEHLEASAEPTNLVARGEMLMAAWLALAGYPNQMAGLNHGIGHQLGGLFGVPHGVGAGCVLPYTMSFNREAAAQQLDLMGRELLFTNAATSELPDLVIDAVRRLIVGLQLPTRLRDVGVPRDDLAKVADLVFSVEAGITGNPRPIESADEILEEVLIPAW